MSTTQQNTTATRKPRMILPDTIVRQLEAEAREAGDMKAIDMKTIKDCDVVLCGHYGPGDDEYDAAMCRLLEALDNDAAVD